MAGLGGTLFLFSIFCIFFTNSQNHEAFKLRGAAKSCIEIQPASLSSEEKNYLIQFHEYLRENISKHVNEKLPNPYFMKNLTWSDTLAKMARKWAGECKDTKDANLDASIGQYMVASVGNSSRVELRDLLRTWMDGLIQLTPSLIDEYRKPKRGEYNYEPLTQILWWNTEHFGCGKSVYKHCMNEKCTEPQIVVKLVCNYYPAGNKEGEPVYFSEKTKSFICSKYPEHSYCSSEEQKKTNEAEVLAKNRSLEEEKERKATEYRIRSRMIDLWPAAGSQVNVWHTFNIKYFHFCLSLAILPYLNYILSMFKLI